MSSLSSSKRTQQEFVKQLPASEKLTAAPKLLVACTVSKFLEASSFSNKNITSCTWLRRFVHWCNAQQGEHATTFLQVHPLQHLPNYGEDNDRTSASVRLSLRLRSSLGFLLVRMVIF